MMPTFYNRAIPLALFVSALLLVSGSDVVSAQGNNTTASPTAPPASAAPTLSPSSTTLNAPGGTTTEAPLRFTAVVFTMVPGSTVTKEKMVELLAAMLNLPAAVMFASDDGAGKIKITFRTNSTEVNERMQRAAIKSFTQRDLDSLGAAAAPVAGEPFLSEPTHEDLPIGLIIGLAGAGFVGLILLRAIYVIIKKRTANAAEVTDTASVPLTQMDALPHTAPVPLSPTESGQHNQMWEPHGSASLIFEDTRA